MEQKLTSKQNRFVEEYLIDLNATKAAIRAGYSEKTAFSIGCENLKKPYIHKKIKALLGNMTEKSKELRGWVLNQMQKESMEAKSDSARIKALELLGRYLGLWNDKIDLSIGINSQRKKDIDKFIDDL